MPGKGNSTVVSIPVVSLLPAKAFLHKFFRSQTREPIPETRVSLHREILDQSGSTTIIPRLLIKQTLLGQQQAVSRAE
jgi:hypothetical protein